MARATPLQKPYGTIQKRAVETDRDFNNHLAGDSGFGRPVKRGTRFKHPLKQSASPQTRCGGGDRRYGPAAQIKYGHLSELVLL